MEQQIVAPPGHPDAITAGCLCPQMENWDGAGRGGNGYLFGWYIQVACPLHGGDWLAQQQARSEELPWLGKGCKFVALHPEEEG